MTCNRSDILRILNNSRALLEEAQHLFDHGFERRAGFLALASLEELLKAMSIEQSQGDHLLTSHKHKLRLMNDGMASVFSELLKTKFTELASANNEETLFSPEQAQIIDEYWHKLMTDLSKIFQFDKLRQHFLYEDLSPPKEVIQFRDSINSSLAKFVLQAAHVLHKAAEE
ncbi:MAG: AbiV family abortive infection protein [Oligoflexia bacterium]|nr:AbiV family abortive infection protein [Oligoflexia bacterium]